MPDQPEENLNNANPPAPKKGKRGSKRGPYKGREQELFILWLSMPLALRQLAAEKLRDLGYDPEDPEFKMLLEAKTRTALAKVIHVHNTMLSRWENDETVQKKVEALNQQNNVLRFKRDVDHAFTQKTIATGDSSQVMAWYKIFMGFKEKSITEDPETAAALREHTQALRELAGKK